jgi:HTH-type transcriptional regulator/antitoxin HigA
MTDYKNDTPPPGHFIKQELEERGLAQRDLAYILGTTEQVVTRLLSGKHGVSPEMAKALGQAFDVNPELFINLQAAYDLAHAKDPDVDLASRARWQNTYPVREMINRGWIKDARSAELDNQMARFFKAANANEVYQPAHAAKKTNTGEPATGAQIAWLYRVVQIAEHMTDSKPYSVTAMSKSQRALKALMANPEDIRRVPALLADCGIRFIIVEGLPNAKIDGVCHWLDTTKPVIGMTLRFDRIDNFWFVLWHELMHVLNRHAQKESIIDVELEGDRSADSADEREANHGAAEACVPQGDLLSFLAKRNNFISEMDVKFFAQQQRVHSGIVVGQIQRQTKRWNFLRKHLVSVRQYIVPTATVDGWGNVAQVQ